MGYEASVTRSIRIGLLGAGVVGQGILRLLEDHAPDIERRLGARLLVERVAAKSREKARPDSLLNTQLCFDPEAILEADDIDIVVEVVGGVSAAGDYVRRALRAGKPVVTANKALLAEYGHELIELAEEKGVDLYFEAAVAGGIPVLRVLREALASDSVVALRGIVNGTSNYILSRMREEKLDFAAALREAQALGFAEADPTLDVSGGDAAHKLTILATLAFGARLDPNAIPTEGIEAVGPVDIELAERFGYVIKPLAVARPVGDALDLRVHPALVPAGSVLSSISGALNAVELEGAMLGPCLLSGYGAGALPTAMSIVSDIVDVARNLTRGASGRVPQFAFRGEHLVERPMVAEKDRSSVFYLRFSVKDRPGIMARIAGILGAFDVSIHHMVQEGRAGAADEPVQVVMLTHECTAADLRSAVQEINALEGILPPSVAFHVEADMQPAASK